MPQVQLAARPIVPAAKRFGLGVPQTYVLLVAAWLLDYPSEGEGQGLQTQAIFLGVYLFALIVFLIGDRNTQGRIQGLFATLAAGALYLAVAIAAGLVEEQSLYRILRNALTVAIYLTGMLATARVVLVADPARVRRILGILCLLYAVANFIMYVLIKGGINFASIRYEIIGISVIAALAYLTLVLLFRLSKAELAAMAVNAAIVLASITRTYLLVALVQFLTLAGQMQRVLTARVIFVGMLGVMALMMVLSYGDLQLVRWQDRLFGAGSMNSETWTVDTRFSEWSYMVEKWTSSFSHLVFGTGLASETVYILPRQMSQGSESMIGFGHNQHLSMLFTAGLVGGVPLLIVQFLQGLAAWRFARQTVKNPHLRNDAVFLGAWGALIVIGCLVANMFDSIFTYRGDALWYGIGTGLLLGARARFDPANAPRGPRPGTRPAASLATT